VSVIGPCPGTTTSAPSAAIKSQAEIQFSSGPAHTIGVPLMKRMSPVYTTFASGTCTITSPLVCAGPTSINSTTRPATSMSRRPSNVRVGGVNVMPSKSKSPKNERNNSPTSPGALLSAASIAGGTCAISSAADFDAMISAFATRSLP
jgi:hypothetical protein